MRGEGDGDATEKSADPDTDSIYTQHVIPILASEYIEEKLQSVQ